MAKTRLVIATTNEGKYKEIAAYFAYSQFEAIRLRDVYSGPDADEPYDTIEQNAMTKARFYGRATNELVLADDSGVFVDALKGWPGVYSARIAPTASERNAHLLKKMIDVPDGQRQAEHRASLVVYNPTEDTIMMTSGVTRGEILRVPTETATAWGYDPVFFIPKLGKTYAELSLQEKNEVSHRGKALQKMIYLLKNQYSVKHVVVPIGLIIQNGKILLNLRNDPHNERYHRKWEFPGGSMDFGETPEQNVIREIREEAGIDAEVVSVLPRFGVEPVELSNGVQYQAYLIPYVCRVKEIIGAPHDAEVLESRWCSFDEVETMDLINRNLELWQESRPLLTEVIAKNML